MAGPDRAVNVLKLFTIERPAWSVEDAAIALGVSTSSAYRYFAVLTETGLLTAEREGTYVLGPAIIQYDRQIQLTDPLLRAARESMAHLLSHAPQGSTVLLCRIFRDAVLCIHQLTRGTPANRVSYERGRPMPLFRGATSKIMLPFMPPRDLRRLQASHEHEIAAAGLGGSFDEFRRALATLRRSGHAVTHAEIDPDCIGIGAPILDPGRRAVGSLSYVIPSAEGGMVPRLVPLVVAGAREVEARLTTASPLVSGAEEQRAA